MNILLNRQKKLFFAAICFFGSVFAGNTSLAKEQKEVEQFVQKALSDFFSVTSDPSLSLGERKAKFSPMLEKYFELKGISRFVLGRYGKLKGDAWIINTFLTAYKSYVLDFYAKKFEGYSTNQIKITKSRYNEDHWEILTKIPLNKGEKVSIKWFIYRVDSEWQILDLSVEDISMASAHRDEFSNIIQTQGGDADALVTALRKKTAQNIKDQL